MGRFVYFVRHGETVWNVENKICGATDIALTDHGHEQAVELGEYICQNPVEADVILSSPLSRALDTANHISELTGLPVKIEPRLKEQNFGKYESTPRDGEEFRLAKMHMADSYEGGESMFRMAQRIYDLLDEIRTIDDHTYILVAHNGIARFIHSYFFDMTNEEFSRFGISNCEILKYEFKD